MTSGTAAIRAQTHQPAPATQAAGIAVARSALPVEIVRTRAALDLIAAQWQELEARLDGAVLFQSCAWARAVFDFEAARGNVRFDPVIVTLRDGSRLVAVLPLERIRTRARTVLTALGHAYSQYSDVMLAPGIQPGDAVSRLLHAAIKAAPCDAVSFLKVRGDSMLASGMPADHMLTGTQEGAPYIALDAFPDFAGYFATINHKTRKNMRNARNRLERDGPVTHHIAASTQDRLDVINRTLKGRAERLNEQGLTSRAFGDTAFTEFCQSLASRDDLPVLAMSLRHKGEAIAEQWGFVHNQRYYAFVASRDFSNSDESPGKLHLGEVIHVCADQGLRGADLMVPVMPYKLTWATETVTVRDFALPVTRRGLLVLNVWDRLLRPAIKKLVLAMPAQWRGPLMRAAGRRL